MDSEDEEFDGNDTLMEEEEGEDGENFEDRELEHNLAFKLYCKRFRCFAHTCILVMSKFNKHPFQPLSKYYLQITRKYTESVTAVSSK